MPFILLLLLIAAPLAEIYVLIKAGGAFGAGPTIAAVAFTALLGAFLVRSQGRQALDEARADLAEGAPPVAAAVHGVFLLVAGAFLLAPGFITDTLGFLLLIPPVRLALGRRILKALRRSEGVIVIERGSDQPPGGPPGR
ncbi:MAG: FxsA family protein [Pseudomonadota bacterium]